MYIYIILFQETWTAHPVLQQCINCVYTICSLLLCIVFDASKKILHF